jgi:plasmid replication initiation protein
MVETMTGTCNKRITISDRKKHEKRAKLAQTHREHDPQCTNDMPIRQSDWRVAIDVHQAPPMAMMMDLENSDLSWQVQLQLVAVNATAAASRWVNSTAFKIRRFDEINQ